MKTPKASEAYKYLCSKYQEEAEAVSIQIYILNRLKCIQGIIYVSDETLNEASEIICMHFIDSDVSVDCIINSIINYVNKYEKFPNKEYLKYDIEGILEDF